MARRYARVALWSLALLVTSALYLAITLLPTLASLRSSTYGASHCQGGAPRVRVFLAIRSRRHGIGRNLPGPLSGATPLEAGILVAILLASSLLIEVGPPATAIPIANLLGPQPLSGPSLQEAGLAGSLTVGIAANVKQIQIQVYSGTSQEFGTVTTARARLANRSSWRALALVSCGSDAQAVD